MSDHEDLARFTLNQLTAMHTTACNTAGQHWTHAKNIVVVEQAVLGYTPEDQAEWDRLAALHTAVMAAGDEQFELARHIGAEINRRAGMRSTADA